MVPELASKWKALSPTRYQVDLKRKVTFHDGAPLTAYDVAYTFNSLRDPDTHSPYYGVFKERFGVTEVKSSHRVVFNLVRPSAMFLSDLVMGIVPKHLAHRFKIFNHNPVGSGPYRLLSRRGDQKLELAAHNHFHDGPPRLPFMTVKVIRNEVTRYLELLSGKADLVQNALSPLYLQILTNHPLIKVKSAPSILYTYIGINLRDPILKNLQVRRALAHAIDRKAIIRYKFQGRAVLSTGLLAPMHWAYNDKVARYPYSIKKAMKLLDAAGYPDPDGAGPKKRFTITFKTSTDKFRISLAQVMAGYLNRAGIGVKIRPYEWGTFFSDIKKGNFQIYSLQWTDLVEPDMYHWIFHSTRIPGPKNKAGGANRGAYINPELDKLLEQGQIAQERKTRRGIYNRVQEIIARDLPYISLWHEDNIAFFRHDLRNVKIQPDAKFYILRKAWKAR